MFEHFTVTVSELTWTSRSKLLVRAKVCVRTLPPDPQGDRTRISWDPWTVRAGSTASKPTAGEDGRGPDFPYEATYKEGSCASGWLHFAIKGDVDTIVYSNGVGDHAVWSARHLDRKPRTSSSARGPDQPAGSSRMGEGTYIVNEDVRPGRYKARARSGATCYWARLRDDSGDADSIIANDLTRGAASVTIKRSDGAFTSSGCTTWTRR